VDTYKSVQFSLKEEDNMDESGVHYTCNKNGTGISILQLYKLSKIFKHMSREYNDH
jgi:uncharacterized lipoprotein YehR (DUF1307 family)